MKPGKTQQENLRDWGLREKVESQQHAIIF